MSTDYDQLADLFATFEEDTDGLYRPWLTKVLARGERAIDLGCGSGRWTDLLLERYTSVRGVDTSGVEVGMAAERHPQATFETRDLMDVNAEADGQFDLVFSVNTVHHLNDHDKALPHLRSLVAPGGQVVVIDILNDHPLTRPQFHEAYGAAFPGAEFADLHRVITGMRWTAPE